MTTHTLTHHSLFDNSWLPKTLQWFPPPNSPDLDPCDLFPFPKMKLGLKGRLFTWLRRFTHNRKRLPTHSYLRTSIDAWNHGKHTGIAVYVPKGTTSNETAEPRSYGKKFFMVKFPFILVVPSKIMWSTWLYHIISRKRNKMIYLRRTNLKFSTSYLAN